MNINSYLEDARKYRWLVKASARQLELWSRAEDKDAFMEERLAFEESQYGIKEEDRPLVASAFNMVQETLDGYGYCKTVRLTIEEIQALLRITMMHNGDL